MHLRRYLPTFQFTVLGVSLFLAVGLIFAAYYITSPKKSSIALQAAAETGQTQNNDWQESLEQIQAESGVVALPEPLTAQEVGDLLAEADSSNITTAVARSLLINLSNAKSQGLGSDLPTQEKLIADATARASGEVVKKVYTTGDLTLVAQNVASLKQYGNTVMSIIDQHPAANYADTYLAIGYASDYGDTTQIEKLRSIGGAYASLANDLSTINVPQTLAPLHLKLINDFAGMAQTYDDMIKVLSDPLRGLSGLQQYKLLQSEAVRVFTNIAQELERNSILFTKEEPGAIWSAFLTLEP